MSRSAEAQPPHRSVSGSDTDCDAPSSPAARSSPTCRSGRTPARCRASCTSRPPSRGCSASPSPRRSAARAAPARLGRPAGGDVRGRGVQRPDGRAVHPGIALPHIAASGNADLIDRFVRPTLAGEKIGSLAVTEPGGGSDVAGIRTTAVREGDEYVINGAKTFITSGVRADFVTTAVRTGGPGHAGVSLIVVEAGTPGFTVDRSLRKMGWHCSDTAELSYVDVRVPAANLVGEENTGFYQIAEQFVVERIGLAVHAYGIARARSTLAAAYCRDRETFGKPLVANQVVRHKLVEMRRQVEVARTYTREVAARHVAGENVIAEACLAKQTACDAATYVCDQAVQLHGGTGYMHGTEVERHYRDARILPIGGGATEVLTDLAARLLGYTS